MKRSKNINFERALVFSFITIVLYTFLVMTALFLIKGNTLQFIPMTISVVVIFALLTILTSYKWEVNYVLFYGFIAGFLGSFIQYWLLGVLEVSLIFEWFSSGIFVLLLTVISHFITDQIT